MENAHNNNDKNDCMAGIPSGAKRGGGGGTPIYKLHGYVGYVPQGIIFRQFSVG